MGNMNGGQYRPPISNYMNRSNMGPPHQSMVYNIKNKLYIQHDYRMINQDLNSAVIVPCIFFKGRQDPSHFLFEINVGKRRIRH